MDKEQALEKLSKVYDAGTVLFREGDPGNAVWVINSGKVQLSKRVCSEEIVLETLGAGDFFGEIALVSHAAQSVTATALTKTRLLTVDAAQFENMLRANGELSMRMLRKLAGRLNEAQYLASAMFLRNTVARVMLHIRHELSVAGAAQFQIPDDMALTLGLDRAELDIILAKLVAKNVIALDDKKVSIRDNSEFNRFLNYLVLKDRYEFFEND